MTQSTPTTDGGTDTVRVWLVERTYSDDEQNIVILVYATPDGERYLRKERALTSFGAAPRAAGSGHAADRRDTTAAIDADPGNLGETDPADREQYASEAERMAAQHEPADTI